MSLFLFESKEATRGFFSLCLLAWWEPFACKKEAMAQSKAVCSQPSLCESKQAWRELFVQSTQACKHQTSNRSRHIGNHCIVNHVRPKMQSKVACRKLLPCESKPACYRPTPNRRMQAKLASKKAKSPIEGCESKKTCFFSNFVKKIIFIFSPFLTVSSLT